jgi:GMP reductase
MDNEHLRRFDFSDINLIPKKCIVTSRSECDTRTKLLNHTFKLPVVPANMECVINEAQAMRLASNGYFYIYHRFASNNQILNVCLNMRSLGHLVSISVGVNKDSRDLLELLYNNWVVPDFVTIDIAHGHSLKMEDMIHWIKSYYHDKPCCPFIIAGNVSTAEAVVDLEEWGADAIKVGIGPGSACTTYNATGFGSRGCQASVVQLCSKARRKECTLIIADGGIQHPGDIAKSLVLGADMVMIGGMFSGLQDSPGSVVSGQDGKLYKEFWGSASAFHS